MPPVSTSSADREDLALARYWRDTARAGGCTDILSERVVSARECRGKMRQHARAWALRHRPPTVLPSYLEPDADAA